MRNFIGIGLFAVALLGAAQALGDVTLGPGETLDWDSNAPASGEEITVTGGTLNFESSVYVTNVFNLNGEVTVNIADGATVRFARTFRKRSETGRMVLSRSAEFGSNNNSVYSFLPANSIAFAADAPAQPTPTPSPTPKPTPTPNKNKDYAAFDYRLAALMQDKYLGSRYKVSGVILAELDGARRLVELDKGAGLIAVDGIPENRDVGGSVRIWGEYLGLTSYQSESGPVSVPLIKCEYIE